MHMQIICLFIGLLICSLAQGRPQGNINNYPYRPQFSDLDPYSGYYTTVSPYQQNVMRIWPYIIDTAVSPLYNWNWNGNGYNTGSTGYNTNGYNNNGYGYNTNYNANAYGYNPNNYNGYNNNNGYNSNNGYYNTIYGMTTASPWQIYNQRVNSGRK